MANKSKQKKEGQEVNHVTSIQYNDTEDGELITLINTYISLRKGAVARTAIRELLFEVLPEKIDQLRNRNRLKPTG